MAIITTYPDDSAAASGDKYLTVDEDGSTKLTTLATLIATILATDSITTAMIEDDAITAAKTSFGGDYSTSEVSTGFTWTDGKTIYKKTISFGALTNNSTKSVAHGISNISTVISIAGSASNGSLTFPLPTSNPTASSNIALFNDLTNISISTGTDRTTFTASVTMLYTKTT